MLLHAFADRLTGKNKAAWNEGRIRGTVVLVKKDALDLGHFQASLLDGIHQILGQDTGLTFQLVSATKADHRMLFGSSRSSTHATPIYAVHLTRFFLFRNGTHVRETQAMGGEARLGRRRTWRRWWCRSSPGRTGRRCSG